MEKRSIIINFFKKHKLFLIFLLIFFITATFNLNKELFIDWDECLYSVYPWEMKKNNNYLVNQWNSYIDLQKPPLYSWLLQIPFLFGKNEFFPRLLSLIASSLILATIYFFSYYRFSRLTGLLSFFFILFSDIFLFYSQKLNTDIFFTLFILLGFVFWQKKSNLIFTIFSGIFFGLAVMVKGLSVFPFLLLIFLTCLLQPKCERLVAFLIFISTFLLITLPWHLLTWLNYKTDFIMVYLIENLIQRSRYPIEFHFGGRRYYFEILFKQYHFWLAFIFYYFYFFLKSRKKISKKIIKEELSLTIFFFFFLPLLFFTLAKTKISWYLMPIYPFLSLFLAISLTQFIKNKPFFVKKFLIIILIIGSLLSAKKHLIHERKNISPRNEIALRIRDIKDGSLNYLVPQYERTAKILLEQSPHLKIRSTFIYGGNPCMVYYSEKKVFYFYSINEFMKALKPNQLFLVENNDLPLFKDRPIRLIHQNKEFTLFKLKTNL